MEFFNKIRSGLQFTSEQMQKIIKNTIEECLQQLIENKEKKMTMQLDCETWAQFQIVVTRVETNDTYHVEIYQKTSIR